MLLIMKAYLLPTYILDYQMNNFVLGFVSQIGIAILSLGLFSGNSLSLNLFWIVVAILMIEGQNLDCHCNKYRKAYKQYLKRN